MVFYIRFYKAVLLQLLYKKVFSDKHFFGVKKIALYPGYQKIHPNVCSFNQSPTCSESSSESSSSEAIVNKLKCMTICFALVGKLEKSRLTSGEHGDYNPSKIHHRTILPWEMQFKMVYDVVSHFRRLIGWKLSMTIMQQWNVCFRSYFCFVRVSRSRGGELKISKQA